ncbi:MAG: dihydrodipicolinate synthase family protein [Chloroflexota bacterium]
MADRAAERWRGIFTILLTPFAEDSSLDEESLRREVDFVIAAGAHGIVTPVNTSEFFLLADDERRRLAEVVVDRAAGRVPVVIGTAAPVTSAAVGLTRHARATGAAGVIAMPPYVVPLGTDGVLDYYSRIAEAADGLPVVLQNVGGQVGVPMRADAVVKLAQAVPAIRYVKEETLPSTHRISELLAVAGDTLDGVFGGSGGRALVDELQRGACGLMSGCQLVDAQVKVYNLLLAGDEAGARAAFARQLPAQTHWGSIGLKVAKEVLRRRGVFRTTVTRKPDRELDAHDHAEITWALGLAAPDLIPTGTLAGATR